MPKLKKCETPQQNGKFTDPLIKGWRYDTHEKNRTTRKIITFLSSPDNSCLFRLHLWLRGRSQREQSARTVPQKSLPDAQGAPDGSESYYKQR
jgi:hypothetical protein